MDKNEKKQECCEEILKALAAQNKHLNDVAYNTSQTVIALNNLNAQIKAIKDNTDQMAFTLNAILNK